MINIRQAQAIQTNVDRKLASLSDHERNKLARAALTIAEVRVFTLDRAYYRQVMALIEDAAPTFADELNHLIETVEDIHRRIPAQPPKIGITQ